mmetsp:Transcript_17141/g.39400  ORF Transcript_17141/g.39400 Transcript_17141/m.39400 type:complete len:89 (+) Transcript_17141:1223-1489(+)
MHSFQTQGIGFIDEKVVIKSDSSAPTRQQTEELIRQLLLINRMEDFVFHQNSLFQFLISISLMSLRVRWSSTFRNDTFSLLVRDVAPY